MLRMGACGQRTAFRIARPFGENFERRGITAFPRLNSLRGMSNSQRVRKERSTVAIRAELAITKACVTQGFQPRPKEEETQDVCLMPRASFRYIFLEKAYHKRGRSLSFHFSVMV